MSAAPEKGMQPSSMFSLPRKEALTLLGCFAVALIFYLAVWPAVPLQDADSPEYLAAAEDLLDFRLDALHHRTPGYPVLLALTGSVPQPGRPIIVLSLTLHLATVWLLVALSRKAGVATTYRFLLAGLLLLPARVENANWVLSDTPTAFWLALGTATLLAGLWSSRNTLVIVAGVAFGIAGLTRPVYLVLWAPLAFWFLVNPFASRFYANLTGRLRTVLALTVPAVLIAGTFVLWNFANFDFFGPSPRMGYHLGTRTVRVLERLPESDEPVRGILIRARDQALVESHTDHRGFYYWYHCREELLAATGMSEPELSRYLTRLHVKLILAAPLHYLEDVTHAFATYWFPAPTSLANFGSRWVQSLWVLLHFVIMAVFFAELLALLGVSLLAGISRRRAGPSLGPLLGDQSRFTATCYTLAGVIVFFTAIVSSTIEFGAPRVRICTDGLILAMCFWGWLLCQRLARSLHRAP